MMQQSTERRKLITGVTRVTDCEQGTQRNAIKLLTAGKLVAVNSQKTFAGITG